MEQTVLFRHHFTIGLRSAAMACQRSTAAVTWVSSQQGRVVFNYLDDFIGVSPAFNAQTNFQALSDLLSSFGLHESSEKACPPSPVMICLGVELNTDALTLSVSPGRLCELEQLLEQTNSSEGCPSVSRGKTDLYFQVCASESHLYRPHSHSST